MNLKKKWKKTKRTKYHQYAADLVFGDFFLIFLLLLLFWLFYFACDRRRTYLMCSDCVCRARMYASCFFLSLSLCMHVILV